MMTTSWPRSRPPDPTVEGFVKPEVVAPGGHMHGLMQEDGQIFLDHPETKVCGFTHEISGTSQAAAVVSGVTALMLDADPSLSPDEVKCRLMASAHPAVVPATGLLAYSVFQQGAGLVNAWDAVYAT